MSYSYVRQLLILKYGTSHLKKLQLDLCPKPVTNEISVNRSKTFKILAELIKNKDLKPAVIARKCQVSRQRVEQVQSLCKKIDLDLDKVSYSE